MQAAAVITWSGPGPGCSLSLGPVTTLSGENTALFCTSSPVPQHWSQHCSLRHWQHQPTMCPQPRLENAICNQPRPVTSSCSSCSSLRFLKQLNYLCTRARTEACTQLSFILCLLLLRIRLLELPAAGSRAQQRQTQQSRGINNDFKLGAAVLVLVLVTLDRHQTDILI